MENKKCNKCEEVKSINDFYRKKETKDGVINTCKICSNEIRRIKAGKVKPILTEKKCVKCGVIKDIKNYTKVNINSDGYTNRCHSCSSMSKDDKIYEVNLIKDISGYKSGFVTTLNYEYSVYDGKDKLRQYWKFKCECGTEFIKRRDFISRPGNNKSCGCYKKPVQDGLIPWYNQYRTSAKSRGHNFDLTLVGFKNIISKNCYYCGAEPTIYTYKSKDYETKPIFRNGIDRKDNSKGYTLDNATPCCKKCNIMKMAHSFDDWTNHMKKILKNLNIEI